MDWTERYRPDTLAEIRGNDAARDALREWAESWPDHRTAAIVHGSPGVGKTSAAHALANDMGWDQVELNASDSRTKSDIQRLAGRAANNTTLGAVGDAGGSSRQLVIVDEADNFHGNADRGGSRAVTEIVKSAGQPVVLIANDFYEMSNTLRSACEEIDFRDVSKRSIVPVLRDLCRKEDVEFTDAALEAIASANSGDLRGAIKDLQATAQGRSAITEADVVAGRRDRTKGIFDYLDEVIKEADAEAALKASYDVDETPDDLINWIEDNMPKDYAGAELADAYGALADADRWLGRVRATQNYSYWRYAGDAMTAGVAAARREQKGGWTRYSPPSYWSKLGRSRGTRDKRDYVARHIAETNGVSMATARREILPHLRVMTHHCKNRDLTVAMAATYDLDAEHVAYVTGSGKDTNKVASIVDDAADLRSELAMEHSEGAFEGGTSGSHEGIGSESDESGAEEGLSADGDEGADRAERADSDEEAAEPPKEEQAAEDDQQAGLGDFA
jgi:replication factor C large subunit